MTSNLKNPSEMDAQSKSGVSPRTNAVCLEVNVTLRSLPGEASAQSQPIREDLKTVIVFDNGAVLRSANNLPAGMTLILSNGSGRDVVCRVVTGRSMPAVKGYVEVEFMEPVKDFWDVNRESAPAAPSAQASPPAPKAQAPAPPAPVMRDTPAPSASSTPPARPAPPAVMPPVRPTPAIDATSNATNAASTGPLEYDEFPAPMGSLNIPGSSLKTEPTPRPEPVRHASWTSGSNAPIPDKAAAEYSHQNSAEPTSVASWMPPEPKPPAARQTFAAPEESSSANTQASVPARDFMSKGLMAYEKPSSSEGSTAGKTPLILGMAAVVLAGVCGVVFFMHRGNSATPVAKATVVTPPATPQSSTAAAAPALKPMQTAQESAPPAQQSEAQPQVQAVAAQPVQPAAAVAPIPPAEITLNSAPQSGADARSARRQDKAAAAPKQQAQASAPKRPMISDLKMAVPSAPNRGVADSGNSGEPVAEIASADMPAGAANASLLSTSGRTSGQPAAPAAPPPPPKVLTDAKLVSSTRPVYPPSARQANIEGSVNVVVNIDPAGRVSDAKALSGPVMLRAAAEDSVKLWKYSPALEDGKPVQSHTVVRVDFKISN